MPCRYLTGKLTHKDQQGLFNAPRPKAARGARVIFQAFNTNSGGTWVAVYDHAHGISEPARVLMHIDAATLGRSKKWIDIYEGLRTTTNSEAPIWPIGTRCKYMLNTDGSIDIRWRESRKRYHLHVAAIKKPVCEPSLATPYRLQHYAVLNAD